MNPMQKPGWATGVMHSSCTIRVPQSMRAHCISVPSSLRCWSLLPERCISLAAACAGLVFFNLPQDGAHAQEHLALLFFVLLLYQLLPFCYVSAGTTGACSAHTLANYYMPHV